MIGMTPRRARAVRDHRAAEPAEALRAHLIATTSTLLAEHGLHGLTTRRIASAASVADGVLYNYFADKDDLVLTALRERFAELVRDFTAAAPDTEVPLTEGLRALAAACLDLQTGVLPLAVGLLDRPDLLARFLSDVHATGSPGPRSVLAAIAEYLTGQQGAGHVDRGVQPRVVATLLIGATALQALTVHLAPATSTAQELDEIAVFLARGCLPAAPRPDASEGAS